MPFTSYDSLAAVAQAHHIQCRRAEFIQPLPTALPDYFRADLAFNLRELAFESTEYGACETLIFPFLREIWKPFHDVLSLWSHEAIAFDQDLCGVPDYLVTRRSPLGPLIMGKPYLLVVEAKRDDFWRGWAQCAAAMLAAVKLNDSPDVVIHGIVTNGRLWEFARLHGHTFTQDVRGFALQDIDELAGAIHFALAQCRAQVVAEEPCPT